ncbi:T9SS type A sorting domain-containing protein [candidate division KSB1 bacterium]|nr:T9SS type A sorting domain-containing protein [candidate division KSB1 bacterium]
MNRLIILAFCGWMLSTPLRAEFVEQFRSAPNRRIAKTVRNVLINYENIPEFRDMNRNGVRDRIRFRNTENGVVLGVFDGLARAPYWWFPLSLVSDLAEMLGFCDFKGNSQVSVLLYQDHRFWIIDAETKTVEYSAENVQLFGLVNVDQDPQPEIAFVAGSDIRQVVVVGWQDGVGFAQSVQSGTAMLSDAGTAMNAEYSLTLKYNSGPGHSLAFDPETYERINDLDLDDDGAMDIPLLVGTESTDVAGLFVRDIGAGTIKWQFQFPDEHRDDLSRGLNGFFDLNNDGEKEALFGYHSVVTRDGNVHTLDDNFQMLAVADLDNDGADDLVGIGLADSSVQVWGIPSGTTSITETELMAAGFALHQNYPNPFNPETAIRYQLSVVSDVDLSIYNVNGQLIRTLVQGVRPAGMHQAYWDGLNNAGQRVASGPYLYRLEADGQVLTRRMLLLK